MRNPTIFLFPLLVSNLAVLAQDAAPDAAPEPPLLFAGCGGAYFLAEPGDLEIEVFKRDSNRRGRHTELRAILVGPDRRPLQEVVIPDDGLGRGKGAGPLLSAKLSVRVERKGVFALNVTVSQDRYGEEMVWGLRTSCPLYLIETARGHRDERHEEPIVLAGAGGPTTVCFLPRRGAFRIGVTGLSKGAETLRLLDVRGALVRELAVAGGKTGAEVPAGVHRDAAPWRLELPSSRAQIQIDGLTRWERGDPLQDACLWTPEPSSWFPLHEHRWLLTPYSRTAYGEPGARRTIAFRVHNNATVEKTVSLRLEFPGAPWTVRLTKGQVRLPPGSAEEVALELTVPAESNSVHLRATPADVPGFTTYSTLEVRSGAPPVLSIPLRLAPYRHENEQLGYVPRYPVGSQPYFDPQNRAFIVEGSLLSRSGDGSWETTTLPYPSLTTKVAFERDGGVYLIAGAGGKAVLLHSADGGRSFETYEIPGRRGAFDIEQFSGHNTPEGPPPFVRFVCTARDPKLKWRRLNDLELYLPRRIEGRIEIGEPILVSKTCIGLSTHSGLPSSIVSRGDRVHVTWGEASDPEEKLPGVPTFVVTCDRRTRRLGEPALIGYGPPANDVHNTPSITIDSKGYLHVLIGTHGRPFQYAMSVKPNDAGAGWTRPVTAGEDLRQTYIGFVCGRDDALYTVFRLWRTGAPFPHSLHATLAFQRKLPGKAWEPPRILVVSPFSEYSVFRHRLTIDRTGRLFLSKEYWSTYWFYRNDLPGNGGHWRSLMMSPDGGESWKLAADGDLRG